MLLLLYATDFYILLLKKITIKTFVNGMTLLFQEICL